MSPPEDNREAGVFTAPSLPGIPRDDTGPVFAEPWQAQAFALVVKLHEEGHFAWKEWTETLGAEFKAATARGEPDDGSRYYEHWVGALEKLIQAKGVLKAETLLDRKEVWKRAYRATPHGQQVTLHAAGGGTQK